MVSFGLLTILTISQMLMISSFNKGVLLISHYLLLVEKITVLDCHFYLLKEDYAHRNELTS